MNSHGDERKISLKADLSSATAEEITRLCLDLPLTVLKVTYWNNFPPWEVPERRINDNLGVFVDSGFLRFRTGGAERILKRGDCVIVPEYQAHDFGLVPGKGAVAYYIFHALHDNIASWNPFEGFDTPFLRPEYPDFFLASLRRIAALREFSSRASCLLLEDLLRQFFVECICSGHFHPRLRKFSDPRIPEVLNFIYRNASSNLSVLDIANHIGIREVRFRRIFRENIGASPLEFLTRVRLNHAMRLLARYDYPLSRIAQESGFSSESYFCAVFQKKMHCSPSYWRTSFENGTENRIPRKTALESRAR